MMRVAPSGYYMAIVQEGEHKSEGASTWRGPIPQGRVRGQSSAVSRHEKLLLVSVLLVVAIWVIFRLLQLLTLD
jgi:hypothetical protein